MIPKELIITLIFIALDIVTGFMKAIATGTWSSSIMREGAVHKFGEIVLMIFCVVCEWAFPYIGIEITIPIVSGVCLYLVIMETGSVLENIMVMSPDLEKIIGKVFDGYGDKDGKHSDDTDN